MNRIIKPLLRCLGIGAKTYKIQTFTYYIPSPPSRRTGYREKHFDKVFYDFINRGYKILDMKTQNNTGVNASGMWIIFTLQATNDEAEKLNLSEFSEEQASSDLPDLENEDEDETVEGLYQINN